MSSGPVCHIPPTSNPDQPGPVALPSIPSASPDVNSLTATVNAMRQVLNYITGRQGPNGPGGGVGGGSNGFKTKPDPSSKSRWAESNRVVVTERVFQNNDKTSDNWVDVERIARLTMQDRVTGEQWTWDRDRK